MLNYTQPRKLVLKEDRGMPLLCALICDVKILRYMRDVIRELCCLIIVDYNLCIPKTRGCDEYFLN